MGRQGGGRMYAEHRGEGRENSFGGEGSVSKVSPEWSTKKRLRRGKKGNNPHKKNWDWWW